MADNLFAVDVPLFESGACCHAVSKNAQTDMTDNYVWKPSPAVVEYSNIGRFMRRHRIRHVPGADFSIHRRDRVVLAGGGRGSGD